MSRLKRFYSTLRNQLTRLRLKYTYWTLTDTSGKESFGIVGGPYGRYPFKRLYFESQQKISLKAHTYAGGSSIAQRLIQRQGMVVISEISIPDELKHATLKTPSYIGLTIPLPPTLEGYCAAISSSAYKDIIRVRKQGFTYEIARDVSWTDEFYARYYQPSIEARFGEEGYVASLQTLQTLVRDNRTEFIKIMANGRCIAALLNQIRGKRYKFLRLGWLDNDTAYVKQGAVTALYWFSIQRAYQLACSEVMLGGTLPYLDDGLFWFKAKWGGRLLDTTKEYPTRNLLLDPANPVCYRFLKKASILAYGPDESFIVLTGKSPEQFTIPRQFWQDIRSCYRLRSAFVAQSPAENELPPLLQPWYEKMPIPSLEST